MKKGIESLGRLRAQGLVLLGLAFVSGGFAGIAIEHARLASRARGEAPPVPRSFPRRGLLPPQLEHFDLSQEQRTEIEAILERTRPATDSILQGAMPRLGAIMEETREEIRQVLTPEQRRRLDAEMPPRRGRRGPRARSRPVSPVDTTGETGGVSLILHRYSLHNRASPLD